MFITALLFLGVLAVVILSHEWGHFIAARKLGMRVDEFGFGFPPRIFGKRRGETLYSFNLLPIGGFVRIFGEGGEEKNDPRSFASRPVLHRSLVITAGVLMNVLVAFVLFSSGHMFGTQTSVYVSNVVDGSPAQIAGLEGGDKIIKLSTDAQAVQTSTADDVGNFIEQNNGMPVIFTVERNGGTIELPVQVRNEAPEGEGLTGIQIVTAGIQRSPWYRVPWDGARTTFYTTHAIGSAFIGIVQTTFSSGSLPEDISGPLGIAAITGEVRGLGVIIFLQFIALISLNLAILNLIPFPGLDGGRFLFLMVEKVKGAPLNPQVEGTIHMVGIALLLVLLALVTFQDIRNLI